MNVEGIVHDEVDRKILSVIFSLEMQVMFNGYALENIVLHNCVPGTQIPYERYIDSLGLRDHENFIIRAAMPGRIIDQEEKTIDRPVEEYYKEFYNEQVSRIFENAPKRKGTDEETSIISFKYGLKEYLEELYPVFTEILSMEVRPTFFELLAELTEKSERVYNIAMMTKFISAIKIKKLRQGSRVDRYISKIIYRSVYLERLIKPYKGHYLLANSNTESLDYKLAVLSCFMFCTSENEKLFELKIKRWEERKSLLTNER